jgi:ferredoxin
MRARKTCFRCTRKGDAALEECDVACDACGKCALDAPDGVISMVNNLPVVDYSRNHNVQQAIDRCPTGAIIWFDEKLGPQAGRAAHKVVRQHARNVATT